MATVLNCVYGLLLFPETADPLDSNLAMQFFQDRALYESNIRANVDKYASMSFKKQKENLIKSDDQ